MSTASAGRAVPRWRGTDVLNGTWQLLDRTPKGRDEGAVEDWPGRKDEYPS